MGTEKNESGNGSRVERENGEGMGGKKRESMVNGMGKPNGRETTRARVRFSPRIDGSPTRPPGPAYGLSTTRLYAVVHLSTSFSHPRADKSIAPPWRKQWLGLLARPGTTAPLTRLGPSPVLLTTTVATVLFICSFLRYEGHLPKRCICLRLGGACTGHGRPPPSDDDQHLFAH